MNIKILWGCSRGAPSGSGEAVRQGVPPEGIFRVNMNRKEFGMFKKCAGIALAVMVGASLALGGAAQAKGFKDLSFMGSYMGKHPTIVHVWEPFFKAAEEKFPGKNGLSFHYFAQGELYPESEAMTALTDGRVDFGTVRPSLFPGNMSLLSSVAIPGMCPNAIVGSLVTEELIEQFPEVRAELPKNSTPFVAWASAAYQIHTINPVRNMEELKGKKIIVWDATTLEIVKALGAVPLRMTSPDTYLALSKGMGDGVLCPLAPLRSFKISEATKHHLILNSGVNTFVMNVHTPLWNDMPKDMQDWLKAEGGMKMALDCGKSLEDGALADTRWMEEQGHKFYYLSEEERARALEPLAVFTEKWKNEECRGIDPALVNKVLTFVQERSKYHTDQMKAGVYGDYKM